MVVPETEESNLEKSFIPDVDGLQSMNFTSSRALMLKQWIDNNDMDYHQQVFYWIHNYIDNMFRYYILVTGTFRYPWSKKVDE